MNCREVERKIVERFVDDALKAGCRLSVSLERGYDISEILVGSQDRKAIMAEIFAGDECHVFVQDATGPTIEDGRIISWGWAYFVLGNGPDILSDYSVSLAGVQGRPNLIQGAEKLADRLSA